MIVRTKTFVVPKAEPRPETALEKTTRIVRGELDADAEKRKIKTAALRTARMQREAATKDGNVPSKPKVHRGTAKTKLAP